MLSLFLIFIYLSFFEIISIKFALSLFSLETFPCMPLCALSSSWPLSSLTIVNLGIYVCIYITK